MKVKNSKLTKTVPKWYALIAVMFSIICIVSYYSYAMFTVEKVKNNAVSIATGTLNYTITGTDVTNNKITIAAKTIKTYSITLTSLNTIDSKYQLYYQAPTNVFVYYDTTADSGQDTIAKQGATGNTKTIKLVIYNKTTSSQTITLGVEGGFTWNEVTLQEGNTKVSASESLKVESSGVKGGRVTASTTTPKLGDKVTFTTSPSSDFTYVGADIKNKSGTQLQSLDASIKEFTMPEENVVIYPKWKKNDKVVFMVDSSDEGAWGSQKNEGVTSGYAWQSSRHYFYMSSNSTLNSRIQVWSPKTYDLTDYTTFQMEGYEFTLNSSYSADNYHVTFYVGVAKTTANWVHAGVYKQLNAPGNNKYLKVATDITNLTGNYYLGFELLSNSHPYGVNITGARLLGRTYQ